MLEGDTHMKKGQMTLTNLVALFVTFIMLVILLPIIVTFKDNTVSTMGLTGTISETLLNLVPIALILGFILTAVGISNLRQNPNQ